MSTSIENTFEPQGTMGYTKNIVSTLTGVIKKYVRDKKLRDDFIVKLEDALYYGVDIYYEIKSKDYKIFQIRQLLNNFDNYHDILFDLYDDGGILLSNLYDSFYASMLNYYGDEVSEIIQQDEEERELKRIEEENRKKEEEEKRKAEEEERRLKIEKQKAEEKRLEEEKRAKEEKIKKIAEQLGVNRTN
jgi:hypothetical protein